MVVFFFFFFSGQSLTFCLNFLLSYSHVTQQTSWLHPVSQVQHLPPIAENEDNVRESQTWRQCTAHASRDPHPRACDSSGVNFNCKANVNQRIDNSRSWPLWRNTWKQDVRSAPSQGNHLLCLVIRINNREGGCSVHKIFLKFGKALVCKESWT